MVSSAKKAEASVGEQQAAASAGSLATYKPDNDMSQRTQFLAHLLMNVGAGLNIGRLNPAKAPHRRCKSNCLARQEWVASPRPKPKLCKMHLPFQWLMQSMNNALDLFMHPQIPRRRKRVTMAWAWRHVKRKLLRS